MIAHRVVAVLILLVGSCTGWSHMPKSRAVRAMNPRCQSGEVALSGVKRGKGSGVRLGASSMNGDGAASLSWNSVMSSKQDLDKAVEEALNQVAADGSSYKLVIFHKLRTNLMKMRI